MLRCRGGIMGGEWQGVGGGEARRGEGQGREEKKTVNSPFLSERTYHCVSCKYEGTRNATEYLAWRTGGVLVLDHPPPWNWTPRLPLPVSGGEPGSPFDLRTRAILSS